MTTKTRTPRVNNSNKSVTRAFELAEYKRVGRRNANSTWWEMVASHHFPTEWYRAFQDYAGAHAQALTVPAPSPYDDEERLMTVIDTIVSLAPERYRHLCALRELVDPASPCLADQVDEAQRVWVHVLTSNAEFLRRMGRRRVEGYPRTQRRGRALGPHLTQVHRPATLCR